MTLEVSTDNDHPYMTLIFSGSDEDFSEGTSPIAMDFVNCTGSEANLWDCVHFTHSYSGCDYSHDVGVRCQPGKKL